ncbi:hypothetical protein CPB83DRAFT_839748 [Crepidotus variabilis]|uniref:Uncharacterized protein n=1 Tax=Crepidotus variabilis TaxID=179855 RepID=A0A9P6E6D2_9AGAR|nr:hypothetical protein CPB83DRAFT_839748 [Crepidotus variabilis]
MTAVRRYQYPHMGLRQVKSTPPRFQANGVRCDSTSSLEVESEAATTQVPHAGGSAPNTAFLPSSTGTKVVNMVAGPAIEMGNLILGTTTHVVTAGAPEPAPDIEANQHGQKDKSRWQLVKMVLKNDVWPFVKKLVKWLIGIVAGCFIKRELEEPLGGS